MKSSGRILRAVVTGWHNETIIGNDDEVTERLAAIKALKDATIAEMPGIKEYRRQTKKNWEMYISLRWFTRAHYKYTGPAVAAKMAIQEMPLSVTITEISRPIL